MVPGAVGVRDSTDRGGPVLLFTTRSWATFLGDLAAGRPGSR